MIDHNRLRRICQFVTDSEGELQKAQNRLDRVLEDVALVEQAMQLTKACLQVESERAKQVEHITDGGIKALFGPESGFSFDLVLDDTERIKGLSPTFLEAGVRRDATSVGAAMRAYASFFLRLAFLLLQKQLTPIMILDEHPTNGDSSKPQMLVNFLLDLQTKIDVQFVFITHDDIEFPNTIVVRRKGKVTEITNASSL